MKNLAILSIVCLLSLLPLSAWADVKIHEWYGQYDMNHDGWRGILVIGDSKRDCAAPPWCSMTLSYTDSKGARHQARIERLDDNLQHMVFYVDFQGNQQKFDAYLFSWDKTRIAGTTYWGGRTFGFYAVKKGESKVVAIKPEISVFTGVNLNRRILPDGTIETRSSDGTITQRSRGGIIKIFPDGKRQTVIFKDVQPLTPPTPPPGSATGNWLAAHGDRLLDIIIALVPNDSSAKSNYLGSEDANSSLYERIYRRTETINYLVSP
ncbi:MAG: hypothetical protein U0586_07260 [Candidatus Brocadiaceae bacterium]